MRKYNEIQIKYTMKDYEYLIGEGGDVQVYTGSHSDYNHRNMKWKLLDENEIKKKVSYYLPPVDKLFEDHAKKSQEVFEAWRDEYVEDVGVIPMNYLSFDMGNVRKIYRLTP